MIKKILFSFGSSWSTPLTLHGSQAVFCMEQSPVLAARMYKSGLFLRVYYKSILLFYSGVLVKCISNNYHYTTSIVYSTIYTSVAGCTKAVQHFIHRITVFSRAPIILPVVLHNLAYTLIFLNSGFSLRIQLQICSFIA